MAQAKDGHFVRRITYTSLYGLKTQETKLTRENYTTGSFMIHNLQQILPLHFAENISCVGKKR